MSDNIIRVWVTGSDGQLGRAIQKLARDNQQINWVFTALPQVDITNPVSIENFTRDQSFDFVINCAAYTNVESAELNTDKAFKINAEALGYLAKASIEAGAALIHISTDYVFDGNKDKAYTEDDPANPINVYGKSKLKGEEKIRNSMERYYIIRTSWLYSEYGLNFFNTIRSKIAEGKRLKIMTTQKGCPTNAHDLAKALLAIIESKSEAFGIYHFCNRGLANWYIFAEEIIRNLDKDKLPLLEAVNSYPTKAKRPINSELNTEKFESAFAYRIPEWRSSLRGMISGLKEEG